MTFRLPFAAPFQTAHGSDTVREGIILRVMADDLSGLGEASPVPSFGGRLADTLEVVQEMAPHLVGLDLAEADTLLAEIDTTTPGAAAAACAIDTAICDVRAQAAGTPVAKLLGANGQSVSVNTTVGAIAAETSARRAIEAGFTCVKLKVGICGSAEDEIARIRTVRAAIGPGVRLRLDANGAWDVEEAVMILRAVEPLDLELVEQPVAADDLAGMAEVRAAVATPIAADESVGILEQARLVIAAGSADILIVKPMLAGGLRPARAVVELAQSAGLRAIVTTTIDAGVGVAAALHLAATLPEPIPACGLATGPLLVGDLLAEPLSVQDSAMRLPVGPGLGVTLDERQLARYGHLWKEVGC